MSLEGSLKLKEISYIHSEAYAAGELKHGTISLIEEGTLVVALATHQTLFDKMMSNVKEVKARGAVVLGLTTEGNTKIEQETDHVLYIPQICDIMLPSLAVVPLQLFAYYVASMKGATLINHVILRNLLRLSDYYVLTTALISGKERMV